MSSQRVEVSSNEQFSDKANRSVRQKQEGMLHPNWRQLNSQMKNKAKSTCGDQIKKNSQADQILYYKQKAHQSFMQVIQVQQLHEQQIQQLKQQYQSKICSLQNQIKQKNQIIEVFQKNSKHHILELQKTLQMEGLQLIQCRQTNLTRFDDSTILSFKQFLSQKQGDAKIQSMRQAIFRFITNQITKINPNLDILIKNIKKQINSIFQYVKQVRQQLLSKVQSHQSLLKKYQQIDSNHKKLKAKFQAIQKDAALMAQNLRKLKDQKFALLSKSSQLQKKNSQMQKQLRLQQNSKQALLKISLKDNNNNLLSSRNLIGTQKSINKNPTRLKVAKSYQEVQDKSRSNLKQQDNDQGFIQKSKWKINDEKDEESFNMKDLIAEINDEKDKFLFSSQNSKIQRKPQQFVPLPQQSKLRKKSFDN